MWYIGIILAFQNFEPKYLWNLLALAAMSNQELILTGRKNLDETDRSIERSKKVCTQLKCPK
jgi:hypothetical protein